jgi:hypothetical protein
MKATIVHRLTAVPAVVVALIAAAAQAQTPQTSAVRAAPSDVPVGMAPSPKPSADVAVATTPVLPPPPFSGPTDRDANADRVVLMPTAYTHPQGTLYLSAYDLAVLQIGYAFTDRTQVSLTATPPIEDVLVPLDLTVKAAISRQPHVRVALLGSVSGFVANADDTNFSGPMLVGRAGGVVQLCPGSCASSLAIATNLTLAGPVLLMANGVGGILHVSSWLDLLLEVDTLVPLGREAGQINGLMVSGGLRIPRASWALDVAVGRTDNSDYLPLLVLTYRR